MNETLDLFAAWLRGTSISEAIRVALALAPVRDLHFFGLSLLIGIAGFFDLRLLGFMKRVPISAAWTLMPWAKFGFALAALTGVTFFIAHQTNTSTILPSTCRSSSSSSPTSTLTSKLFTGDRLRPGRWTAADRSQ